MMSRNQECRERARAYPRSDAQPHRPAAVRNEQGLLHPERVQLKKLAQTLQTLRWATLNVGSMTGKGRELAALMKKRRIEVLCVQETRWKGDKARELGDGYKIYYSSASKEGRNGVGIILSRAMTESVIEVHRRSDRLMRMKLDIGSDIQVISAYAPQAGLSEEEKDEFWMMMDSETQQVEAEDRLIVGGDLNGHIGRIKEGSERVHGGFGLGDRNEEGERIADYARALDLAIVNTYFDKKKEHLVTYKSGERESQIDYLLIRRNHLREALNCKVIPGDHVAAQHRPLCMDLQIKAECKKPKRRQGTQRIKWYRLKDPEIQARFKEKTLKEISTDYGSIQEWWEKNSEAIRKSGREVLGETSGKIREDKESWWWNTEVQEAVAAKKEAKKKWDCTGTTTGKEEYNRKKRMAKRAVAQAKAQASQKLYEDLETTEGQKEIYRIARQRNKATKDTGHVKQIRNTHGEVLRREGDIQERWKNYFQELLNVENERRCGEEGESNEGLTREIARHEVQSAVRKMKNGKAVGPDVIPVEVWKTLGEEGIDVLWDLMKKMYEKEEMPHDWRKSTIVPIYKGTGDAQACKNYRGIKLMSHTMKVWERIIDNRLREEVEIAEEQFGFMPGRSTTDAIFALRQLTEKIREKQQTLHLVFIDLEKAYDRVPRQEIWRSMRKQQVPEKYVRLVQETYREAKTCVRTCLGETELFNIEVGLHQGSALSPFLFNIVMDTATEQVRESAPRNMMFADDIVLCERTREGAEQKLEQWREALESRGLKVNREKTEYLCCGEGGQDGEGLNLGEEKVKKVNHFKYLGSVFDEKGEMEREVNHRVQAGWKNWRDITGVLCDRKMPVKLKGKLYKTVVRPALLYGVETLPLKTQHTRKLHVTEMKMLRWACGVTRLDKIRNERIRGTVKVAELQKKIQEVRLRWYGHVMRRDDEYIGKRVMKLEVEGKRGRGRPKKRWKELVEKDMREKQLEPKWIEERARWRRLITNSDPI